MPFRMSAHTIAHRVRLTPRGAIWALSAGLLLAASASRSADWPEWRGVRRDGVSTEKGLLKSWPAERPRLLWQMSGMGTGYSSVSIVGGKLYTMGDLPGSSGEKRQCVVAFDLATRKRLWATPIGKPHSDGSRSTPTVKGGMAYVVNTDGDVVCLRVTDGGEVWRRSLERDFGGRMMSSWRYSESPLVDGNRVIVTPGVQSAAVVALDSKTGETIWRCAAGDIGPNGADGAGYSSTVVAQVGSKRLYVQQYGRGVIGVEASSGRLLWSYNKVACRTANIMTPIVSDGYVFVSNAYRAGAACLRMTATANGVEAQEVYFIEPRTLQNHHGGLVAVAGYVYGGHGQNAGAPTCIELKTGKVMWQTQSPGRGSAAVLYADGRLIFRYENGLVTLLEASPQRHSQVGSFEQPRMAGPAWSHPVVLDGKLYLRHNDALLCYDVKAR